MSTFSDFKKDFYNRIGDGSVFDCGSINLLKVALDGLRVKYADKGNVHTPLFGSLAAHQRFLFIRRMKALFNGEAAAAKKELARYHQKRSDFLVIDHSGRFAVDEQGRQHSLYSDRIVQALQDHCTFILESAAKRSFPHDLHVPGVLRWLKLRRMSAADIAFRSDLQQSFSRISSSGIFNEAELRNIRAAVQLFFDYYRGWDALIALVRPKTAILGQHYHREGLLLALKQHNVHSVELQHGLIAEEDVFYIFPSSVQPVIRRALFADRILVYGEFWKQRLLKGCEYPEETIGIIGYYHFESHAGNADLKKDILQFRGNGKLLLVTTQTSLHPYFISYLDWLAKDVREKKLGWKIIVKPHPAEKKGIYDVLKVHDNIRIAETNLEHLFPLSDLHLSVYSTTLFDAIRFGISSYALYVAEYGDYVEAMINAGVAQRVTERTNFLADVNEQKTSLQREYYYSGFEPDALKQQS